MARTKQYADRVNVIKRIKVNGKWPFAPWSNATAGSSAIMCGFLGGMDTTPVWPGASCTLGGTDR
jgi:hypothetical protein